MTFLINFSKIEFTAKKTVSKVEEGQRFTYTLTHNEVLRMLVDDGYLDQMTPEQIVRVGSLVLQTTDQVEEVETFLGSLGIPIETL